MKKEDVIKMIEQIATSQGFKTTIASWNEDLPEIRGEDVLFFTKTNHTINIAEANVRTDLEFRAEVCRMGGNPSPSALRRTAWEIMRGASMVETLNALELWYVTYYEDGDEND